jgi:hypothetical protein
LDVLAGVARAEAKLAALKAQAVAVFAAATKALNAPAASPYEAAAQERSLVAEVGCVLAIGDRAAGDDEGWVMNRPSLMAPRGGGVCTSLDAASLRIEAAMITRSCSAG